MNPNDDIIQLFPVADSEIGGQLRSKSPAVQNVLIEHGDTLTSKATLALLYHGRLVPDGDEASLLVIEFRFLKEKNTDRFRNAKMRVSVRDADGHDPSSPRVYRIAPKDSFSIEPGEDVWKITRTGKLGVSGGYAGVSASADAETQTEREKKVKHSILLTGKTKREAGGFLGDTVAAWALDEDPVDCRGIPTVLRTAMLLKRPIGRSFKIDTQIQTEVNWRAKLTTFFGRREQFVDLEDIEVDPKDPTHIVVDEDEHLSNWIEQANQRGVWDNLGKLNLQEELVLVVNEKLMANK